ncbi:MAG: tyrosine-type recombinase/integrase [Parafilimonas terrae]|nr:tyrosine-type recombinase/integrase [Parafilimonas terrae]
MPRPADPRKAYLEFHGAGWRVVVFVPAAVRRVVGATKLVHNLDTDSLRQANARKRPHVERFKRRIAAALASVGQPSEDDLNLAVELSRVARDLKRDGTAEDRDEFDRAVYERHAEIRWKDARWIPAEDPEEGPTHVEQALPEQTAKAMLFSAVAHGRVTPFDLKHEEYLGGLDVKGRTLADDARALRMLKAWCEREEIPPMLEAIDVSVAHAFVDHLVANSGLDHVTCKKYVGRLAAYWQWMAPRLPAAAGKNAFAGIVIRRPKRKSGRKERAFTDRELADLLLGPASPHMQDLMMIGALSGARLDAIVDLKVQDTDRNCFRFKAQKSEPGDRYVPIHPELRLVVARRRMGKAAQDDLFPEWPPVRKAGSMRERSFKTSNHFTLYRRSVGVDDQVPGKRRSLVNFHSFRRWFITRMERADVPGPMIASIVGHTRGSITLDVYSEGPAMRAARKAIARIGLPPLDGSPIEEEMGLRAPEDR